MARRAGYAWNAGAHGRALLVSGPVVATEGSAAPALVQQGRAWRREEGRRGLPRPEDDGPERRLRAESGHASLAYLNYDRPGRWDQLLLVYVSNWSQRCAGGPCAGGP